MAIEAHVEPVLEDGLKVTETSRLVSPPGPYRGVPFSFTAVSVGLLFPLRVS